MVSLHNVFRGFLLCSGLCVGLHANAGAGHDNHHDHAQEHHHQQKKHVHGLVEMRIAFDKTRLDIEVNSPAVNILGFEHKAKTSEQKDKVRLAKLILNAPEELFAMQHALCKGKKPDVDFSAVEHDHEHDTEQHKENVHSEISVRYKFECQNLNALESIQVNWFEKFSGIEMIQVQWVSDEAQGSQQLTPSKYIIKL